MAGYIRQDTTNNIADGNVINASDFDNEYNAIEAAFHATTGHTHDGTAAEGAPITKIGPTQDVVASATALTPKTDNTVDLGSSTLEFKDLYIDGTANIDSLVADTADINAGTIDGVTIGGSVRGAGSFTTLDANGNTTLGDAVGDLVTVNGTTTFVNAAPTLTPLTASQAVFTNGSKTLVSNAITGTGNVVMSASPTLTGTISAAAATLSGNLTLSGGTANGVLYLDGSKVATSGSALTFDGTNLGVPAEVYRTSDTSYLRLSGGNSAGTGANVLMFGSTHATNPNRLSLNAPNATATSYIDFGVAGAEAMRLTSTGLAIGTSSPLSKLHVNGNFLRVDQSGANSLFFGNAADLISGAPAGGAIRYDGTALRFGAGSTQVAMFDSSGNLGIGTTPGYKLDITAPNDSTARVRLLTTTGYNILWSSNNSGGTWVGTEGSAGGVLMSGTPAWASVITSTVSAPLCFGTNTVERMRLDSSGNLGLGVTPYSGGTGWKTMDVATYAAYAQRAAGTSDAVMSWNAYIVSGSVSSGTGYRYKTSGDVASAYEQNGAHRWYTAPSGTAGNTISFTQAMTLSGTSTPALRVGVTADLAGFNFQAANQTGFSVHNSGSSATAAYFSAANTVSLSSAGNFAVINGADGILFGAAGSESARITSGGDLLVGTTGLSVTRKFIAASAADTAMFQTTGGASSSPAEIWNTATTGDNRFLFFYTEGTPTARGSIDYDRAGGLVRYNTTSDYRAKDIIGPITNSGEVIDSLKVYEGRMKGATRSRPMLVAHEAQAHAPYAVSGVKDEVNEDGTPKFQQMDVSSLVPLLLAELQSLRARVAALETH